MKKTIALVISLLLLTPLSAFAEDTTGPSISATSMTIGYNCEGTIEYWGFPCSGNHNYEITSSNDNVIDVFDMEIWYDGKYGYDEFGRDVHVSRFIAVGYGTAIITVSDGTYTRSCRVTVPDKRIRINKASAKIKKGKKIKLKVLNAPGKVKWKSSNKRVATVSKNGVVKGKKKGKVTISAKVKGKTYKCKIKVK